MKGFKGRAIFNLLQIKYQSEKELPPSVEKWQIIDYRQLSDKMLFSRLKKLGHDYDQASFKKLASSFDSPEKLSQHLMNENQADSYKLKLYLVIFELWRRFLPDRQTVSTFCDEIDYQMNRFFQGTIEEEVIQNTLLLLENILDRSVDEGDSPADLFMQLSNYLAHDLHSFLYVFIKKQIEEDKRTYASELVDGFYEYLAEPITFDLLKARLVLGSDPEEAKSMILLLLDKIVDTHDIFMGVELLEFLAKDGNPKLFYEVFQKIIPLVQTEKDFKQMLEVAMLYFRYLDQEVEEKEIQKILEERKNIDPNKKIEIKDLISKVFNATK